MTSANGYAPAASQDVSLPIFDVQTVQLRFDVSADFVAAQAANNVLIIALSTGRILRFDLVHYEDIDDIDLPRRPAEIGVIRKLFLDPSASHLIISTALGENYYLHTQSRQPKALSKLRGIQIESIGWNPAQPSASTQDILIGAADGNVYETYIEPNTNFYGREERYFRNVSASQAGPVVGIHVDQLSLRPDTRRVIIATPNRILHYAGRITRQGHEGSGSVYARFFESETPAIHSIDTPGTGPHSLLAVSPGPVDGVTAVSARPIAEAYAWLNGQGIFHGKLSAPQADLVALGQYVFSQSKMLPKAKLGSTQSGGTQKRGAQSNVTSMILTQFHILALIDDRLLAINRLDETIVYNEQVLKTGTRAVGLYADQEKNTYWLFTSDEILEIVVTDEDRDTWRIMLKQGDYAAAQTYAKTAEQKDAVASTTGEHLMSKGKFEEAATVLGRSSKPFEDVALAFIDKSEGDALRKYLLVKLSTFTKESSMQRTMLASWIMELYMAKLNELDDTISTRAELLTGGVAATAEGSQRQLAITRKEFQDFCTKNKTDLDRKTVYDIIGSHGREEELLFFAKTVGDNNYVLSYWIQRERWQEAMGLLTKQTDPGMFYKYSSVLMVHTPVELTEVLMRQDNLEPKKLIPALLNYNRTVEDSVPVSQNQAVRYLLFCVDHNYSKEAAVHNTLISLFASNPSKDETPLLAYLQASKQYYDADFALRLCISYHRVRSCVHIYCEMKQYVSAVELALKHDEIDVAAGVADSPGIDDVLRKKLWLKLAKKVIAREKGVKSAIEFLQRCELLRIEDLIPFFPDFVVIDDFKEEICAALEEYSRRMDELKAEMDDSAATAEHIKSDITALEERYAIVEPGERCWRCRLPLLTRQFFVFPCQHAFHADCLGDMVMTMTGTVASKRIRALQKEIGMGMTLGKRRDGMVKELDGLVAGACVLCSELAVKQIDEPFITKADDAEAWAI